MPRPHPSLRGGTAWQPIPRPSAPRRLRIGPGREASRSDGARRRSSPTSPRIRCCRSTADQWIRVGGNSHLGFSHPSAWSGQPRAQAGCPVSSASLPRPPRSPHLRRQRGSRRRSPRPSGAPVAQRPVPTSLRLASSETGTQGMRSPYLRPIPDTPRPPRRTRWPPFHRPGAAGRRSVALIVPRHFGPAPLPRRRGRRTCLATQVALQ